MRGAAFGKSDQAGAAAGAHVFMRRRRSGEQPPGTIGVVFRGLPFAAVGLEVRAIGQRRRETARVTQPFAGVKSPAKRFAREREITGFPGYARLEKESLGDPVTLIRPDRCVDRPLRLAGGLRQSAGVE